MSSKTDNPFLRKEGERFVVTEEGLRKLSEVVTDPIGQVYAFTGILSPVIAGAVMARLSRSPEDMRVILLKEFIDNEESGDVLIKRVVSEYGDDSVQQLVGLPYVVEGASNLLTKLLEWGRLAAYLEQSTRYIYFDKKDENGHFKYYKPSFCIQDGRYTYGMDRIFENYSLMVREVTKYLRKKYPEPSEEKERVAWINSTRAAACDAIRPVLPAATKSTVAIFASAQSVEHMVTNLFSEILPEARIVGRKILDETRKVMPAFLERADLPERGGAITAHRANTRARMKILARRYLNYDLAKPMLPSVQLISYWPNDELDLVPEMLFEYAGPLSLDEIQRQVADLNYADRVKIFESYMGERLNRRHRPGRAFEKAHFEWEIIGDYGTFRDLQRHRIVDAWEWQNLSPFFGYDVPELVVEAGFEKVFRECFEISEDSCNFMIGRGTDETQVVQSQYAALLGHKMRYRFIVNLREMFHIIELRTGPAGHPGYRKICNQMYNIFQKVYPISAGGMRFVNQGEDPVLCRLAAERATRYKLEKIDSLEAR